ncbi:MAG TPA: NAD(P)-dependent oxidoreductase, partial [Thermoplasmata archaeon]|nr:NAD(P)-dependent oxidoreductase [Thermoplasmata archaeon]
MQPRALVTGAAGFIGSHLVERLLERGVRVVGIDDFDPYYPAAQKRRNLAKAESQRRFTLLRRDLLRLDLRALVKPGTTIYHLAGQPGVRPSWGRPFERYVRNNVLATQHLLEMARRHRPARFV